MNDKEDNIDFSLVLASSVHDMKNSVGMLLSSIEQLIGQAQEQNQDQDQKHQQEPDQTALGHFNKLHYEASRINSDLVQLLTLYRMQNNFLPVRIDEYYVTDLIEEQVARNQIMLDSSGIALTVDCDPNLVWYYDQDLLGTLVHNILVNAVRYTKSRIMISARIEDNKLCLTIADDGEGFPSHMLNDPAGVVEEARLSENATHLGLYFAGKIAWFHRRGEERGFIQLENGAPLAGGVFRVFIP